MKIKILFALIIFLFVSDFTFALERKDVIRVGISNQSFSNWVHTSVKLKSTSKISIVDMSQNIQIEPVEENKLIEVKLDEGFFSVYTDDELKYERLKGPVLLSSNSPIEIPGLNRKGDGAKYDGMIELRISSKNPNGFNIINVLDIQSYLKGVVPNEMPVSFGLEALKAQAVAARNYAYSAKISPDYDVVDSTASQVYYGVNSYREISDKAVDETKGIYAIYNEKPISALYFSTSPGITDDWDDVFGNGVQSDMHPYLKARYDSEKQAPLKTEKDVKDFYTSKTGGFDTNSPKFRWEFEFTRKELEEILHNTLQEQSKAQLVIPKYDGDIKLEGLKEIKPVKRTQSGKITELEIVSKTGTYRIKKELGIRRVLKKNNAMLPSANFFVETKGSEALEEKSENEEKEGFKFFDFGDDEKYPSEFKLIGGGFGHGVGMSQFGAYNMARNGKKYPEILKHYYTNIKLSTLPVTVLYNEYNIPYKYEFYYAPKTFNTVYLLINNKRGVNDFPFSINEYQFQDTKSLTSGNKVIKINITQYLKEGLNTINFAPLKRENKGKYLIYRVEFN